MFEISQIGCGIYLCVLSVIDIWMRKIPVWMLAAGGIIGGIWSISQSEIAMSLILGGAAVGVIFLIVSRLTREGFGYGDSLLILVLGIYMGFWNLLGMLLGAFFLSAGFAIVMLCIHSFKQDVGYPFVPFLCISYIVCLCIGGA